MKSLRDHLDLRLIVFIPVIFILVSLAVGLMATALTQVALRPPPPNSKSLLILHAWIVGSSLLAGLLGAYLAHRITKPVRRAISEARKMIQYAEADPGPIKAANEVGALSTLFERALVSFVELVQAREMLDSVNEGIIAVDKEEKIAGINLKAQEILGISLSEARHKSVRDLMDSSNTDGVLLRMIQSVLREGEERVHNHVSFVSPSGRETPLSIKISPLRLKAIPQDLLGVVLTFKEQAIKFPELQDIIGQSEPLKELLNLVVKVAPTDSTVLLLGESGTGKELIANAIHRLSRRKDRPFVRLNCAAIPETLLESELFGHEKGAFTGADSRKSGQFELADAGTIFFDEIADMALSTQAKILRVLQQKEFTPLGGSEARQANVRIIAASNQDLVQQMLEGRFREDLFYRLNVVTITIPPLRERKTDIPFLADHFLERSAQKTGSPPKFLSRSALDCLMAHSWPGNVRELENTLERAFLLCEGTVVETEALPIPKNSTPNIGHDETEKESTETKLSLNQTLESVEKGLILEALKKSHGIQVEAAKLLGLSHKNLWHKIKKHKIDVSELKHTGAPSLQ
jgi:PAS domain S-box-containing protein